ncbi:hypothetical protein [Micromonospora phaseoli]|nr:hypothetical protein [Micromonospora phaseoli]
MTKISFPAPAAAPRPTEALVGMAEWTLCADQKVYARLHAAAKPTGD